MTRYTNKHKVFLAGLRCANYFKDCNDNAKRDKDIFLVDVLARLQRTAKKHTLLCEFACNGFESEELDKANEEEIKNLEHRFKQDVWALKGFLKDFYDGGNLEAQFQHDPRGLTCKIVYTDKEGTNREINFVYLMEW